LRQHGAQQGAAVLQLAAAGAIFGMRLWVRFENVNNSTWPHKWTLQLGNKMNGIIVKLLKVKKKDTSCYC
jgi:hypothetical protein